MRHALEYLNWNFRMVRHQIDSLNSGQLVAWSYCVDIDIKNDLSLSVISVLVTLNNQLRILI